MGLAALVSEKYIGQRPGHKQVLRSGNTVNHLIYEF